VRSAARAYVLLRAVRGARRQLVQTLRQQPGVLTVDMVEGPMDVILVVGGPDRTRLARTLMKALASVDTLYDGLEMLPTQHWRPVRQKIVRVDTGGMG
jgi:cytochrome P450